MLFASVGSALNNESCAVSGTGVGEYLIRDVVAHTIAMMIEFKMLLQETCDYLIHKKIDIQMEKSPGRYLALLICNLDLLEPIALSHAEKILLASGHRKLSQS